MNENQADQAEVWAQFMINNGLNMGVMDNQELINRLRNRGFYADLTPCKAQNGRVLTKPYLPVHAQEEESS